MKIVIAGGSGQVGTILARAFHRAGDEVVVLSRRAADLRMPWRTVMWDGIHSGLWCGELEGSDAVIGLAGRSVNCRYNRRNRDLIRESRVLSTRAVGRAVSESAHPPPVWLQAGTATIYQHSEGRSHDEWTGIPGGLEKAIPDTWRFSVDVAKAWEAEAMAFESLPSTRLVLMRSAMVMSPDAGGVFDAFLRLVRLGLGGQIGDGRQFVSWIHDADFINAVRFLLRNDSLNGAVNLASPNPLPNREFMRDLRAARGIRPGLPARGIILEAGSAIFRTESELVLKSRNVVPGKLLAEGFKFEFPVWRDAATNLYERWKQGRR